MARSRPPFSILRPVSNSGRVTGRGAGVALRELAQEEGAAERRPSNYRGFGFGRRPSKAETLTSGNTHFVMSDLNNVQIARLLSDWLHEKGLDDREQQNM